MRGISSSARKQLFNDFGNRCAFLGCPYTDKMPDGTPTVQIAHIHAISPRGPRFDPQLSRDEINSPSNFIVVCPYHHHLIDSSPSEYTSEKLYSIRSTHIQRVREGTVALDRELSSDSIETRLMQVLSMIEANFESIPEEKLVLKQELSVRRAGVTKLEQALSIWKSERRNKSEEFWQATFESHPELLGAATDGRPFTLNAKCYVGGKAITNRGGNIVDFLLQCDSDAVLVEIKTPVTRLLSSRYRDIYPPSHELAGAVIQALNYRTTLMNELYSLRARSPELVIRVPGIFILIGDIDQMSTDAERQSFELFRDSLSKVVIRTYDELFAGIAWVETWLD
jgi:Domain of unknown function (DUF4263)